jgi:hypothetical protein
LPAGGVPPPWLRAAVSKRLPALLLRAEQLEVRLGAWATLGLLFLPLGLAAAALFLLAGG